MTMPSLAFVFKKEVRMQNKNELIISLFKIGAIQSGEFPLVDGDVSPIYIDFRRIVSFPEIYQYMVDLFAQEIIGKKFHHIVGVPYAALPLASGIALLYQKPMLLLRKEKSKKKSTQAIEGVFKKGDEVIIVEDMVASGTSVEQAIAALTAVGLKVKDVIVFMDRQQGAQKRLAKKKVTLHALCTLSDALSVLHQAGYLDEAVMTAIDTFIDENQF